MISDGIFERGMNSFRFLIKNELIIIFTEEAVPRIKELIIESYRGNLNDVVTGDYNSLKPEGLEQLFTAKLEDFEYVVDGGEGVVLRCPDSGNFDFSDGLSLIGGIVEGLPAEYYKIKGADYEKFAGSEAKESYSFGDYLIELGFERNVETPENSGSEHPWHYYTLDIGRDIYNNFCLISNTNDDVKDGAWKVYIFNNDSFEFTQRYQVEKLIEVLRYNLKP
jgi:hypothetical protein